MIYWAASPIELKPLEEVEQFSLHVARLLFKPFIVNTQSKHQQQRGQEQYTLLWDYNFDSAENNTFSLSLMEK